MVFLLQYNVNGVPATEYMEVNQSAVKFIAEKILCVREQAVMGVGIIITLCAQFRNVVRNGILLTFYSSLK